MLVDVKAKSKLKNINYKIEEDIVDKFKKLCKEKGIKQSDIIRNALQKAIEELEALDDDK